MAKLATFQNPIFQDEAKAREALEATRWPDGPFCPHCGNSNQDLIAKVEGTKKSHRPGLYYCNECKGQFTVTVGTVFERSKVPLTKWWMAAHMVNSGKNGCSAHEIHRTIGVTYKTAWFMMHRLREAMTDIAPAPTSYSMNLIPMTIDQVKADAEFIYEVGMNLILFISDNKLTPPATPDRNRFHKMKPQRKKRREAILSAAKVTLGKPVAE